MLKRFLVYVIGVLTLGLGIILNTKTGLGVAAINSLPYALSHMSQLSLGNWTTLMYIVFIIIQLIIYRKIDLKVIMQIPFSYIMGAILDFYDRFITYTPSSLIYAISLLILAIVITALGAYLVVSMELVPNPADGLVNALSYLTKQEFGKVKLYFDWLMIAITCSLTLLISHQIIGIGIGTIISAFGIGRVIMFYNKILNKKLKNIVIESKSLH